MIIVDGKRIKDATVSINRISLERIFKIFKKIQI